jgi:hypothetical protein
MLLSFVPPFQKVRKGKNHQVWNTTFTQTIALYTFIKHYYSPIIIYETLSSKSDRKTNASDTQTTLLLIENITM